MDSTPFKLGTGSGVTDDSLAKHNKDLDFVAPTNQIINITKLNDANDKHSQSA